MLEHPREAQLKIPFVTVGVCLMAVACTCSKQPDENPPTSAASAEATATVGAAADTATAGGTAAAAGPAETRSGVAAGPSGGGKTIAENAHGKVQVNDAGSVTAKRANGDSVVAGPGGVTKANGVVLNPQTGTVTIPGQGSFKTP
jgi:hypothetical protein